MQNSMKVQIFRNALLVGLALFLAFFGVLPGTLQADDDLEVEGVIEAIGSDSLVVAGISFIVNGETDVRGPNGAISFTALQVGQFVEVRADLVGNGAYLATRIELEDNIDVEGLIEALGQDSLTVRGVVFWVDSNTEIQGPQGQDWSISDLAVGDFVEVKATLQSNGTYLATKIELENGNQEIEVEGVIQSIGGDSLRVSGMVFYVNAFTQIRGEDDAILSFSDLKTGDRVEVKAVTQPDNRLLATRIKLEEDAAELEIEGLIQAIGADSLQVNGVVFFVDSATSVLDDGGNPIAYSLLQTGDRVEVKAVLRADGLFWATRIKLEDDENEEIELTAPIDTLFNDTLIVANNVFWTDENTEFLNDAGQAITFLDLQKGMIVEIRAEVQANGSLYANRVKVEDFFQDELELTGVIDSTGADFLVVSGLLFNVDANTVVLNDDNLPISFGDLFPGETVEIRANVLGDGSLLATRIKIEDPANNELEISVTIDSLTATALFAANRVFIIDAATLILNQANDPILVTDLSPGLVVEIKALPLATGDFLAIRIKIEDSPSFSVLTGNIEAVSPNFILVSQPQFQITSRTVILDPEYSPVPVANLQVGQEVTVWAEMATPGGPSALQIKINGSGAPTGIDNTQVNGSIPQKFQLGQNYPNPFNPTTTIPIEVQGNNWQQVTLAVFNILGQEVKVLFNGLLNQGRYTFSWDGRNQFGQPVASGLYFYQLSTGSATVATRRMVLIK